MGVVLSAPDHSSWEGETGDDEFQDSLSYRVRLCLLKAKINHLTQLNEAQTLCILMKLPSRHIFYTQLCWFKQIWQETSWGFIGGPAELLATHLAVILQKQWSEKKAQLFGMFVPVDMCACWWHRYGTQGLKHAKQALCHCVNCPNLWSCFLSTLSWKNQSLWIYRSFKN